MANLSLQHLYKVYANDGKGPKKGDKPAVEDFNLEVKDGEFIVLVGPSGCGKSTILRMVAGLEEITKGEIYIDGKLVNEVAPKDRDIAMV
ncbi:MAG: ATP-binding cassette domain-containing protein, partial [Clostridia bacterium]|nr:ATP-binding cassette domain-containing protein [Clostridia bacterium]